MALKVARRFPPRIKRPSERRSRSRSAIRALDMLEFFGDARRPLRAFEVARMLDMQPSTADQLLKTMVDSGHLVFDAHHKTYYPSPRLIGFSIWLLEAFGPDDRLRGLIHDVQARSGMTVTLTTPNDLFMQVIDIAFPIGSPSERGLRISLFGSVVGSAYLATLDPDTLTRLAKRARVAPSDLPSLRETAESVRLAGYAEGPTPDGFIWSIAMHLPSPNVHLPLVLGLAGPLDEVVPRRAALQQLMAEAVGTWMTRQPSQRPF